jgi:hypothetical protein
MVDNVLKRPSYLEEARQKFSAHRRANRGVGRDKQGVKSADAPQK